MATESTSNFEQFSRLQFKPIFKPKLYTWFLSGFGYLGYLAIPFFIFFGVVILLVPLFRQIYLNWAAAAFIVAILLFVMSRFFIIKLGASYFSISDSVYSIKSPLGKTTVIPKEDIIHVEIDYPSKFTTILPIISPQITIATYDRLIQFRTNRWQSEKELINHFEQASEYVSDQFAVYYHRSRNTVYSFLIRMSQDTLGLIGLCIITVFAFFALWGALAMIISPIRQMQIHTLFLRNPIFGNGDLEGYTWEKAIFHPPSTDFWFGTDFLGRDIFSRLIFGTTFTFMVAIAGSLISISLVLILALTSSIFEGWWDVIVTRISDALLTFPPFIPLILVSTLALPLRLGIQGGYFLAIFSALAFLTWPLGMRILRTELQNLYNSEYVQAAIQIGGSRRYILIKHIFPKIIPTILIIMTYTFTDIILGMTLLGFIGLDSESTLTWGSDLAKAIKYGDLSLSTWWTILFPTLWIFLLVFGLTVFSDSIRDNLDPTLRGGITAVPYESLHNLEGDL